MSLSYTFSYDDHSGTNGLPSKNGYWESGQDADLTEGYGADSAAVTRVFYCLWTSRFDFINALLGYTSLNSDNTLTRYLPDPHPQLNNFWAVDATASPMGPPDKDPNVSTVGASITGGGVGYRKATLAKVTATYKYLDYAILTDDTVKGYTYPELSRYISRSYEFQTDYLNINGGLKFVTSGLPLSATPGFPVTRIGLNYTWHEVPAKSANPYIPPNINNVNTCMGKVNSVAFDPLGLDAAVGTVWFVGFEPKLITPKLATNIQYWEITAKFLWGDYGAGVCGDSRAGWNYAYDLKNNRWDKITADGTCAGATPFQSADLNTIFKIS